MSYGLSELKSRCNFADDAVAATDYLGSRKIRQEHDALQAQIALRLTGYLGTAQAHPDVSRVSQLKTTYATPRRTVIVEGEFDDADLIANGSDFADRAGLHQTDASQYL